jgi:hypothetical protein
MTRTDSQSRAEARRRARLAAQGQEPAAEEEAEADPAVAARRPTLLQRLIPPAAQLPGKPDPLAGFAYQGRLRSVVAALFLLRQNPVAWIAPGALYVMTWELALFARSQDVLLLVAQLAQYTVLIAAGWMGWQRPWLFGAAAGLIGAIGSTVLSVYLTSMLGIDLKLSPLDYISSQTLFYVFLGAVAGWYGGYLRRRLATQSATAPARSRRR